MMSILAEATGGMVGTLGMIIWLVVLFAIMQYNRTIKKRCISKMKNRKIILTIFENSEAGGRML